MAFDSFRDFLKTLEQTGQLIRHPQPVATELEITELADREMKKPGGGRALLFEQPTVNGKVSPFPLAINTMGSHQRMAASLGVSSVDELAAELGSLMKAKPPTSFRDALKLLGTAFDLRHAKPKLVKSGPCKDVIHKFPSASSQGSVEETAAGKLRMDTEHLRLVNLSPPTLLNLPIQKCWPLDGGRFITLPCVVTRDPDTGDRNLGMYRIQIYDESTTGMHWQLQKVAARHGRRYYETGQRMPVAIFLGGDPVFTFCATAPLPDGLDEYLLAGYLRKKSIELVKCETNDLEVPANADFVIEGYVDPKEPLRLEGPFGDHTGYYTLPEPYPVFHITAITHRKDAVYPATIVGMPPMEDFYIGGASVRLFLPIFKMNFPEIVDIALPAEGVFHNLVFVSIKKSYPMQAYKIMHGLWGMGQMMFTKYIVVVDDDVDVHNTSEVLFRLCANTDPQRDSIFTKGPADVLDHATSEIAVGSKLGIDATRKLAGEGFKRTWPPLIKMDAEVRARVEKDSQCAAMNYHLHRQGQDVGEFPLEEFRRRRDAGELTGQELVWCQGMPDWAVLDAVLQPVPPVNRQPAPQLVQPKPQRRPSRIIFWVAGSAIVLAVMGLAGFLTVRKAWQHTQVVMGQIAAAEPVAVAAQPVVPGAGTLTEKDVQKRGRAFRVRQWLDGYKEHGQRDPSCDAQGLQLIETWIDKNYGGPQATNPASLVEMSDQLAANPACKDPLLGTVTAVNCIEEFEEIHRLDRALKGFEQSRYPAYPKFYATVVLAGFLGANHDRQSEYDASALQLLKECLTDGGVLPGDQAEMADILLSGWGAGFFNRNPAAVCPVPAEAGEAFKWLSLVLEGEYHVRKAWQARGSGDANTVTQQGWNGFSTELDAARKCLTDAWKLHPEFPQAADHMLNVALGGSGIEEMRVWFDRALAAQIDDAVAWHGMLWGLYPRWHGSLEAMQAFGVTAIDTGRFDTDIPRKYFDVVKGLESEANLLPGQHLYGRSDIWPQMRRMYEGYLAEPSQAEFTNGWRTSYMTVAYFAGQYDVARQQLEKLPPEWQHQNYNDWGTDLSLMNLEILARTGTLGGQIGRAEEARGQGKNTEALQMYRSLSDAAGADEQTKKFVRCRVASLETEERLRTGAWVDFLPASDNDPNWLVARGKCHVLPDGAVEIQSGPDGHSVYSRVRLGVEFEVKGEFEIVRSSTKDFQAGLVFGLPDPANYDWYAFRMKRNANEGMVASLSRGWTVTQASKPVTLNNDHNTFEFRFHNVKATAQLNGQEIMTEVQRPANIRVCDDQFLLGLGAYNDMNETVIRYRNVKVRRLSAH